MQGRCGFLALVMSSLLLAMPVGLTSAAAQNKGKKPPAAKTADAVPGIYRQLIARHIAQNPPRARLLKAEISRPGLWESPFGIVAAAPIACARLTVEGTFSPTTYAIGYRFRDGQILETFNPQYNNPAAGGPFAGMLLNSLTCGKLTYRPFPELGSALRSRPKRKADR